MKPALILLQLTSSLVLFSLVRIVVSFSSIDGSFLWQVLYHDPLDVVTQAQTIQYRTHEKHLHVVGFRIPATQARVEIRPYELMQSLACLGDASEGSQASRM